MAVTKTGTGTWGMKREDGDVGHGDLGCENAGTWVLGEAGTWAQSQSPQSQSPRPRVPTSP